MQCPLGSLLCYTEAGVVSDQLIPSWHFKEELKDVEGRI